MFTHKHISSGASRSAYALTANAVSFLQPRQFWDDPMTSVCVSTRQYLLTRRLFLRSLTVPFPISAYTYRSIFLRQWQELTCLISGSLTKNWKDLKGMLNLSKYLLEKYFEITSNGCPRKMTAARSRIGALPPTSEESGHTKLYSL